MFPKAQFILATKEAVDDLLSKNTKNRNVRKSAVDAYKREILNGNWRVTNQGIGVSSSGVLMDGQHRLLAIREAGYPLVTLLVVTGLDEDAQLYVDQHAKRNMRDALRFAFDVRVAAKAPAICRLLAKCEDGKISTSYKVITANDIIEILTAYQTEIDVVIDTPKNSNFFAASFLAAFVWVANTRSELNRVVEFMTSVERGEMLTSRDPAYHLRNIILNTRSLTGGCGMQADRFGKAVKATMAYLDGKPMGVLRLG